MISKVVFGLGYMCRDSRLLFWYFDILFWYFLDCLDNWSAFVEVGWEKERSYIIGRGPVGDWVNSCYMECDFIFSSTPPRKSSVKLPLLANVFGSHSFIQQILLHSFHVLGTALGAFSPAEHWTKQSPCCHDIYIQWRKIKSKSNKYITSLKANKAGQGLESNRGCWNWLPQRWCSVGSEWVLRSLGSTTTSRFPGVPSDLQFPTGAWLQLDVANRCSLCSQECSTISFQCLWWNLWGRERGKGRGS